MNATQRTSTSLLTPNAVWQIVTPGKAGPTFQPICQILGSKYNLKARTIQISDGNWYVPGKLSSQMMPVVVDRVFGHNVVARIKEFEIDNLKSNGYVDVTALDIVDTSVDSTIGSPIDIAVAKSISDLSTQGPPKARWTKMPVSETEYSDWQIDVKFGGIGNDGIEASYLVHRYVLGSESEYFRSIFRNSNNFSESQEKRSVIDLSADASGDIQSFEELLDFCYGTYQKWMPMDRVKALILYQLADYFGIAKLREMSSNYINFFLKRNDRQEEWRANVYILGDRFSNETLKVAVTKSCGLSSSFGAVLAILLTRMPELGHEFCDRICRYMKTNYVKTRTRSTQVVYLLTNYPNLVDRDLFSKLTESEIMPSVDSVNSSIILMKHERRLGLDNEQEPETPTCLQQRAIHALYEDKLSLHSGNEDCKLLLDEVQQLKPAVWRSLLLAFALDNDDESSEPSKDDDNSYSSHIFPQACRRSRRSILRRYS